MLATSSTRAFHHRWAHPLWLSVMIRGIGLLFLLAGLAKVPVLGALAQTIGELIRSGGSFSLAVAAGVVAAEVVLGSALLLCRRVRLAAGGLILLTGVFLLVLHRAVLEGHLFACNCFGVLGVQLSNRAEFMLDLGLFNLLLFILAFWPSGRIQWRFAGRAVLSGVAVLAVAGTEGYLLLRAPERAEARERFVPPIASIRDHLPEAAWRGGLPFMMFLLRFEDFTCPPCFEDFLGLVDSLGARRGPGLEGRIWALMKSGGAERLEGRGRLERWAEETGLSFPLEKVPDSVFEAAGVRKSMVAVLRDAEHPLFLGEFPIGSEGQSEALRLLEAGAAPGE